MVLKEEMLDMKREVQELRQESVAMELVKDGKTSNKRMAYCFTSIIIVLIILNAITAGLFFKYITENTTEETVTTTKTQEIEDVDEIQNSNIVNGDIYGKDKTN